LASRIFGKKHLLATSFYLTEIGPSLKLTNESPIRTALLNEDDIGKVIRTHIHIESLINSYICKAVNRPNYIKKLQLDYSGCVNLALCLGLSEDLKKPLHAIGTIRNEFAHKTNQKIDKNRVDNFFDTFSPNQKNNLMKTIQGTSWIKWGNATDEEKFTALCLALYYQCEFEVFNIGYEVQSNTLNKAFTKLHISEGI